LFLVKLTLRVREEKKPNYLNIENIRAENESLSEMNLFLNLKSVGMGCSR